MTKAQKSKVVAPKVAAKKVAQKKAKVVEAPKPVFNPEKRYRWTPEDNFTFTGVEFALMLNKVLDRKQELMRELEVSNVLESKLKQAVEAGVALEINEAAK